MTEDSHMISKLESFISKFRLTFEKISKPSGTVTSFIDTEILKSVLCTSLTIKKGET
jgi:hypothetical protein